MNYDDPDILFDILERNKVEELKVCLLFDKWGKKSSEIGTQPKSKSPLIYEPVICDGHKIKTVSHLIFDICEELTGGHNREDPYEEICFLITFFTKNQKITVDEVGA